jgi:hypothetical protein
VVDAGEEGDDRAAHHDVVEVGDDEVGVVEVEVGGEGAEGEAGEAADGEEEEEEEGVEHRGVDLDGALVERADPVEDLDGGRDRDEEGQRREDVAASSPSEVNMWWPQTRKEIAAMPSEEKAMAL